VLKKVICKSTVFYLFCQMCAFKFLCQYDYWIVNWQPTRFSTLEKTAPDRREGQVDFRPPETFLADKNTTCRGHRNTESACRRLRFSRCIHFLSHFIVFGMVINKN